MAYEIPALIFSLDAAADFSAEKALRFVNVDANGKGANPSAGGRAVGVRQNSVKADQALTVIGLGISRVEAGAAVAAGASVESTNAGKAITHDAGIACGVALSGATASGEVITVLLVPTAA